MVLHGARPPLTSCPWIATSITIALRGCDKTGILGWLLSCERVSTINNVNLFTVQPAEVPSIAEFLQALGPVLHHLQLDFTGPGFGGAAGMLISSLPFPQATYTRSCSGVK